MQPELDNEKQLQELTDFINNPLLSYRLMKTALSHHSLVSEFNLLVECTSILKSTEPRILKENTVKVINYCDFIIEVREPTRLERIEYSILTNLVLRALIRLKIY